MKRRSFFQLILACCGLAKLKAKPIHTSGYLELAGRDYIDEFACQGPRGPTGPQGMSASEYMLNQQVAYNNLENHAFSNRFLCRYEGKPIPPNITFTQNCGRAKPCYDNTYRPATQQLKSTTRDE